VTDEYFEWYNVAVNYDCYNDFVEVVVRGPSGSTHPYYRWERTSTFHYAPYYQGTDIDIGDPGSVGRPYDHGMPQCWSGNVSWEGDNRVGAARFFEGSDVIFFTEGPGEYTIEIFISDATDTIVDSALFIDNIRFR
jgi:hypothetical protein